MKLINPDVTILPQSKGLEGVYKQIEIAGRTAYKSEDKITEDSAKAFVDMLIGRGHLAPLEHGTVYLNMPITTHYSGDVNIYQQYPTYCRVNESSNFEFKDRFGDDVCCWHITTNLRFIHEHNLWQDVKELLVEPTKYHEKRITARFICSRGISHELVRHRVFSFVQESTRYCNYGKDKFGNEITYIIPSWVDLDEDDANVFITLAYSGAELNEQGKKHLPFFHSLFVAEHTYLNMLENGFKPQEAREVLPNALKTEVVMTGFVSDWKHFFDLRCAPSAHPDMQVLANKLKDKFIANKIL